MYSLLSNFSLFDVVCTLYLAVVSPDMLCILIDLHCCNGVQIFNRYGFDFATATFDLRLAVSDANILAVGAIIDV